MVKLTKEMAFNRIELKKQIHVAIAKNSDNGFENIKKRVLIKLPILTVARNGKLRYLY